ncbi:MAG: hypothetical protein UY96_C0013G0019 [Parcubacteria group bacterium GW2011_GWB1_56_8]|nr:MAG: hypothetical protein UY96_C0013G0019 [Parcubacteria group bacterium GW2011_GWB1_56_8]
MTKIEAEVHALASEVPEVPEVPPAAPVAEGSVPSWAPTPPPLALGATPPSLVPSTATTKKAKAAEATSLSPDDRRMETMMGGHYRLRIQRRADANGVFATLAEISSADLRGHSSLDNFLLSYYVPKFGYGEYAVTALNAFGKEGKTKEVRFQAPAGYPVGSGLPPMPDASQPFTNAVAALETMKRVLEPKEVALPPLAPSPVQNSAEQFKTFAEAAVALRGPQAPTADPVEQFKKMTEATGGGNLAGIMGSLIQQSSEQTRTLFQQLAEAQNREAQARREDTARFERLIEKLTERPRDEGGNIAAILQSQTSMMQTMAQQTQAQAQMQVEQMKATMAAQSESAKHQSDMLLAMISKKDPDALTTKDMLALVNQKDPDKITAKDMISMFKDMQDAKTPVEVIELKNQIERLRDKIDSGTGGFDKVLDQVTRIKEISDKLGGQSPGLLESLLGNLPEITQHVSGMIERTRARQLQLESQKLQVEAAKQFVGVNGGQAQPGNGSAGHGAPVLQRTPQQTVMAPPPPPSAPPPSYPPGTDELLVALREANSEEQRCEALVSLLFHLGSQAPDWSPVLTQALPLVQSNDEEGFVTLVGKSLHLLETHGKIDRALGESTFNAVQSHVSDILQAIKDLLSKQGATAQAA